jgi:uncharacterized membrane protein
MMWFFWLPLLFVPFGLLVLLKHGAYAGCRGAHAVYRQPAEAGRVDPVEIVRQRLARGEITPEQYEEIRRTLG